MPRLRIKLAIVSPRYGPDVTGGAEMLSRLLAEHLNKYFDVTVITTKAKDYLTWKDFYKDREQRINQVLVKRFKVNQPRDLQEFDQLSARLLSQTNPSVKNQKIWLKKQGPYSTDMFNYIKKHKNKYDLFVFAPYLYATTFFGIQPVLEKSILIPAAHDEPYIYLSAFEDIFKKAKVIITSTPEEKELIKRVFKRQGKTFTVGIGLEKYPKISKAFAQKHLKKLRIKKPYILYLGRIEAGKGLNKLFDFFEEYKQEYCSDLKLILAGKSVMNIPKKPYIKFLGFVSVEEKYNLINQCQVLINPSPYESLSLIVLEAWSQKRPVLANASCQVLRGQVSRAQGGLYYNSTEEFGAMLDWLNKHRAQANLMGKNGCQYLQKNYSWKIVESKLIKIVKQIAKPV